MARRPTMLALAGQLSLAVALASQPQLARAQAFQGSGTVAFGSATIDTSVANATTVTVNTAHTTINWTPGDSTGNSTPFVFLPGGATATYQGNAALGGTPYTVLNRIIPNGTGAMQFNGTVNSDAAGRIWFYSPTGLILGGTARFNVGSLLLTTADPVPDANGNFMPIEGQFTLSGVAGSSAAVVIQAGAQINATTTGQSNYVVALAPRIQQDGAISVRGSAALVAAESATFAIDSTGLFTISVNAANGGTTVTGSDALAVTGNVGGPDAASAGAPRRVYLMAVPKNNAITMAISASGALGFDIAGAANVSGNAIVLSGGRNITDTGTGNPITGPSLINQPVAISIARGNYTSGAWVGSNGSVAIGDAQAGGTPDIKFAGQLNATANTVGMNLTQGANAVAGNLVLDASGDLQSAAGQATLSLDGASTTLTVGGRIDLFARNGPLGSGSTSPAAFYNNGGVASLSASNGAVLSAAGNIKVSSNALGQTSGAYPAQGPTTAGSTDVSATGGGQILSTGGQMIAIANAFGLTASGGSFTSPAIDAAGGSVQVQAVGTGSLISAAAGLIVQAGGTGGSDAVLGSGGNATGGSATVIAGAGGRIAATGTLAIAADATAGDAVLSGGSGGRATAGMAQLVASDGTVAGLAGTTIAVEASAAGGNSTLGGAGGSASAGSATVQTGGTSGRIDGATGITVNADATGGAASGSQPGGAAVGGTATLQTTGAGQAIGALTPAPLTVTARATVGGANGAIAGDASAGTAIVSASASTIAATALTLDASATGDATSFNAGPANAGTVRLSLANSGAAVTDSGPAVFAAASIASATSDPTSGSLLGGHVQITNGGTTLALTGPVSFAVGISGNGQTLPVDQATGTVRVNDAAGATTSLGTSASQVETIQIGQTTLLGSGDAAFASVGSIAVGTGGISGSGAGLNLSLLADSRGTGGGTVNLASAAVSLTGQGAATDIFYNPATFGTPTDYSAGVAAGAWTAYQLVNTLTNLQAINTFLTQNFALNRDLDATATAGWNAGLGFVPLGTDNLGTVLNGGNGFTGRFNGLDHVVSHLLINRGQLNDVGLFGYLGGGGVVTHVGVDGGAVQGLNEVGALVGRGLGTIAHAYATNTVSGTSGVGGLVGALDPGATLGQSFARGNVTGANQTGGLVGTSQGSIDQTYASGTVQAGGTGIGGLVGYAAAGTINRSYALGDVNGASTVGGLVGNSNATISESYASGHVNAPTLAGGLIGYNSGTASNAYWDSFTGPASATGANFGTLTNVSNVTSDPAAAAQAPNYAFGPGAYSNFSGLNWLSVNSETRPIGLWEAPLPSLQSGSIRLITSVHQLQLVAGHPEGDYRLAVDIDASETGRLSGVWGTPGFIPIGTGSSVVANFPTPFTGRFDGSGHVVDALSIARGGVSDVGLFGAVSGAITNLGLTNVAIAGASDRAGALAGSNSGLIQGVFATGAVASNIAAGGLVGSNGPGGTISQSYASVTVTGVQIDGRPVVGGLAGQNFGKLDFVYANGPVSGGTNGGLVGANAASAPITNAYWDTQRSGQTLACGADAGSLCSAPTGFVTAQMQSAAIYAGWSLDSTGGQATTWRIYEGQTAPLLKAFLRPLVLSPLATTTTYDSTVPVVGLNPPPGVDPAHLQGTGVVNGAGRNAGSYTLVYGGGLASDATGYDIITGPGVTLTINPAPLSLNAAADSRVYNANAASAGTVGVVGLQGNDTVTGLVQSFDSANAGSRTLAVNPGYTVVDGNGGGNYTVTLNTAAGTITPAPLTLAAVTDSRVYNASAASVGTVTVSGLQGSDTVTGLVQSFDGANAGSRTLAVNPGYAIHDGNSGANYAVSLVTAAGTITPASATITYTATPASSTYGNAPAGLAGSVGVTPLFGSDSLATITSGTASFTTPAGPASVVGSYAINGGGLAPATGNYTITFAQAAGNATALSVIPRPLTVNGAALSRSYGNANPALTYTVGGQGLVNGDTLSGTPTTPATVTSGVGSYVVSQGSLAASSNYTLTFVPGTLAVTPRPLTVTGDALSRTYGDANPALTYTVGGQGLVNGDSLTGALATSAGASSAVGSYAITQGTVAAGANYALTYNPGALGVTARPITVTADNLARFTTDPNPPLTYVVSGRGLVNGDSLTGALATSAAAGVPAGAYPITQGTLAASANYSLTYNPGTLTVNPCTVAAGCAAGTAPLVLVGLAPVVTPPPPPGGQNPQQQQQDEQQQHQEKKDAAQAESSGRPTVITSGIINTGPVTQPPPVNEPVTSSGNTTLYGGQ